MQPSTAFSFYVERSACLFVDCERAAEWKVGRYRNFMIILKSHACRYVNKRNALWNFPKIELKIENSCSKNCVRGKVARLGEASLIIVRVEWKERSQRRACVILHMGKSIRHDIFKRKGRDAKMGEMSRSTLLIYDPLQMFFSRRNEGRWTLREWFLRRIFHFTIIVSIALTSMPALQLLWVDELLTHPKVQIPFGK